MGVWLWMYDLNERMRTAIEERYSASGCTVDRPQLPKRWPKSAERGHELLLVEQRGSTVLELTPEGDTENSVDFDAETDPWLLHGFGHLGIAHHAVLRSCGANPLAPSASTPRADGERPVIGDCGMVELRVTASRFSQTLSDSGHWREVFSPARESPGMYLAPVRLGGRLVLSVALSQDRYGAVWSVWLWPREESVTPDLSDRLLRAAFTAAIVPMQGTTVTRLLAQADAPVE